MRPAAQSGYALLAAVLITALATVFAAAAVAAVGAGLDVAGSDVSAAAATGAATEAFEQACADLRRRPDRLPWTASGSSGPDGVRWSYACSAVPPSEATAGVLADVAVVARSSAALRRMHALVALLPARAAHGLSVAHDVRISARLTVSGGGLYSGGSVSGREFLTFVDPLGGGTQPPADHVHGELWPVAAVHALGGIWSQGLEVHDGGSSTGSDTDAHTGAGEVAALTLPPSPAEETLLLEAADVRLEPDGGGVIDLSALPAAPASGAAGLVAIVPDHGSPVTVVGERAAASCPLLLLLEGDATLGDGAAPLSMTGAVLSLGNLTVEGQASVDGHLWASALAVDAPLVVSTPADWRTRLLPGLVAPIVLALGR